MSDTEKPEANERTAGEGLAAAPGSAAPEPVEIALVIMLQLLMYGCVWWFDWRLGMAWTCHSLVADYRKDFKARKQQNDALCDGGPQSVESK